MKYQDVAKTEQTAGVNSRRKGWFQRGDDILACAVERGSQAGQYGGTERHQRREDQRAPIQVELHVDVAGHGGLERFKVGRLPAGVRQQQPRKWIVSAAYARLVEHPDPSCVPWRCSGFVCTPEKSWCVDDGIGPSHCLKARRAVPKVCFSGETVERLGPTLVSELGGTDGQDQVGVECIGCLVRHRLRLGEREAETVEAVLGLAQFVASRPAQPTAAIIGFQFVIRQHGETAARDFEMEGAGAVPRTIAVIEAPGTNEASMVRRPCSKAIGDSDAAMKRRRGGSGIVLASGLKRAECQTVKTALTEKLGPPLQRCQFGLTAGGEYAHWGSARATQSARWRPPAFCHSPRGRAGSTPGHHHPKQSTVGTSKEAHARVFAQLVSVAPATVR